MKVKSKKGFTLVELLVVISIIGILAVVAVPSLFKNITKAKISELKNDIRALELAVNTFYLDHGRFPCTRHEDEKSEIFENLDIDEDYESPFSGRYEINCIHSKYIEEVVDGEVTKKEDPTSAVNRIDIGGFTVDKSVGSIIENDEFFKRLDVMLSSGNQNEYGSENKNNQLTVWMFMNIPK